MPDSEENRDRREGWYIAKNIPVAMLLGLLAQTLGFVWWLSALNATVTQQGVTLVAVTVKVDGLVSQLNSQGPTAAVNAMRLQNVEAELAAIRARSDRPQR